MKFIFALLLGLFYLKILVTSAAVPTQQLLHKVLQQQHTTPYEELIFKRPKAQHKKSINNDQHQIEKDLELTIQNIVQIDALSKQNIKQFELMNDCSTRLKSIQIELDTISSEVKFFK